MAVAAQYEAVCTSPFQQKEDMRRFTIGHTAGESLSWLVSSITRKKAITDSQSPLARVLSLFDLTFLGVGTTLGVGVYVMAGQVARDQAGPAVVLSFLIAAIASLLAGFCYAEFAARVPKAGSVYVYAYVTVGELIAFVIGWDLILEYAIGTAGVSRAVTGYIDNLANNTPSGFLRTYMPMDIPHLAKYPDFIAFTFVMVLSVMLAVGVKESSLLNSILTGLNLVTIVTVVIAGALYADPSNWKINLESIPAGIKDVGLGGFSPFGFRGIIKGAATSFFGYVGFDIIATTSEEAKKPRRNIPLAIMISLFIVFATYFSMATVLTMMVPYYSLDKEAPYPTAFDALGLTAIKWIVTIGGIFALNTSLIGGMFPLPRILFSMSRDGLLFEFLGRVNSCTKTPVIATMVSGLLSSVMVLLFDLHQLIDMMSIGTLMAYSLVALCVMVLRFTEDKDDLSNWSSSRDWRQAARLMVNSARCQRPTRTSATISMYLLGSFCVVSLALCGVMSWSSDNFYSGQTTEVVSAIILAAVLVIILVLLSLQPQSSTENLHFAVPLMPVVPCMSILLNIYLMTELSPDTWARFIVWLILGGIIYFSYSIRNSAERREKSTSAGTVTEEMFDLNKENLHV